MRTVSKLFAGVVMLGALPVLAAGVEQAVAHGQVNWTDNTLTVTGSGAPNLKASNVAVARLNAERAAKMDALRNIVEAVKGVRISGTTSAGSAMDASPELRSKVEGIVRGFKVVDTKYYSDGGVDVIVQVPLDGVLTQALVPQAGGKGKVASGGDATGVIINASGLELVPALAPEVVDERGKRLYSVGLLKKEALEERGPISYSKSLEDAMKDARVGAKPIVVKALKATEPGGSNVVLAAAEAQKLANAGDALAAGKVIIVTD